MTEGSKPVTIARDYDNDAVVVEVNGREQRFAPRAARVMAQAIEAGTHVPEGLASGGTERLAEEIRKAADDVEEGDGR